MKSEKSDKDPYDATDYVKRKETTAGDCPFPSHPVKEPGSIHHVVPFGRLIDMEVNLVITVPSADKAKEDYTFAAPYTETLNE